MKPPRGLSAEEAALWARLASSVTPLKGRAVPPPPEEGGRAARGGGRSPSGATQQKKPSVARSAPAQSPPAPVLRPGGSPRRAGEASAGLDSHWDRRLARAATDPDFTLDLHGHTLDQAHRRLDIGLGQAKAMGARLVLLITGKARPVEAADRGSQRGAIRAKILDWLATGPHGSDIAAIRNAHRRHGGDGALYIILKRTR